MLGQFGKIVVIPALMGPFSAHWLVLPTNAWRSMLANHFRTGSISEPVAKAFDGKYPCPLCHASSEGKIQEQRKEFTSQAIRLKLRLFAGHFFLLTPLPSPL